MTGAGEITSARQPTVTMWQQPTSSAFQPDYDTISHCSTKAGELQIIISDI
jgi:hypothetical protein